jgi:tetratricopeptide (TPR) repeat protein
MISSKLGALATALLLSAAAVGGLSFVTAASALAATVRPAVGNALNAAVHDAASGNGSAAMAKIHEAESVPNLTSSEQQAIEQTKNYVAAKTGAGGGATGAKAKFANDYNAGRYSAVVGEDAEALRKNGSLDASSEVIIAQAYYLMHNYDECIRYVRALGRVGQNTLELLLRCAYEKHDEQTMQGVLEQLVVDYNQPKYWSDLLDSADRTPGLNDSDRLDIYRLRNLTNTMKNTASDYEAATEFALEQHSLTESSNEAQAFAQKALDLKLLPPDRVAKLANVAKANAADVAANLAKEQAAVAASKKGDPGLQLGADLYGMGRYQDAADAYKAAIAKGVTDPNEAQIRLAVAYVALHQRDAATHALSQVSKDAPEHTRVIAHLWSIYARTH